MAPWQLMRVGLVLLERIRPGIYVASCTACGAELSGAHRIFEARDWAMAHTAVCPRRASRKP